MKQIKKTGAALLAAAMLVFTFVPVSVQAEDTTPVQTQGEIQGGTQEEGQRLLSQIVLSVGDGQNTPTYKAGDKVQLDINVTNKGNVDAQHVRITPVVEDQNAWPFDISKLNYEQELGTIKATEQKTAVWGASEEEKLTVRDDVNGTSYKLQFRISYDDGEKAYEIDKYVFVKTEAKEQEKEENNQDKKPEDNSKPSGGENVSGNTDFSTDGGGIYNSDPIVSGGGGATTNGSVPRVIVTGFDTEPGEVKAGTDFKLIIHLKNTSKKTAVSNMLFDLQAPASGGSDETSEAPAFLPTSGSSSIYLEKIPAGGTKDISIELNARADLIQKPYSITMSMHYEDSSASQFEGQSSLAIPVKQEARFEFSEIQAAPDTVTVGEEANITCNIYNLGRIKMYNVKAKFEGDAIEGQEQFLGNLESGATGVIDSIVTAVAESFDESNCKLVLTYEDDAGNVQTTEQEFTLNVSAMPDMTETGMTEMMPEEESGLPVIGIVAIIVALAAVGGIVAFVLLRKRKKKLAVSEEEEFLDEVERSAEDERK